MLTCGHYDASGDFAYKVGLKVKVELEVEFSNSSKKNGYLCIFSRVK